MTDSSDNDATPVEERSLSEELESMDEAARHLSLIKHDIVQRYRSSLDRDTWRKTIKESAAMAPIFAALLAPLSTLYDIPALTQRWYAFNGDTQADPIANLAMSATGLAFNIVANALLVLRFSTRKQYWKATMIFSTVCWVIKTAIAVANLLVFGAATRNGPGFEYLTGFWCAVFSAIYSGVISIVLVFYAYFGSHSGENSETRVVGRHFILSELALFSLIAVEALIFSRIEGWSYFDSIYFCMVTALTIGFGDLHPTMTSTYILTPPFALVSVAALGAQVSSIVSFFSTRSKARKERWRSMYQRKRIAKHKHNADCEQRETEELIAEMAFLEKIGRQEENMSNFYDLIISLSAFFTFWILGAMVFHFTEGWTMGIALYEGWIYFLTIGYGDYSPITPAGRVFFVTYSLLAVPVIASFAVQTVTNIMNAITQARLDKERERRGLRVQLSAAATIDVPLEMEDGTEKDKEKEQGPTKVVNPFISHADLVIKGHKQYGQARPDDGSFAELESRLKNGPPYSGKYSGKNGEKDRVLETIHDEPEDMTITPEKEMKDIRAVIDQRDHMLDEILENVMLMEMYARRTMLNNLTLGGRPRLLLQADLNVMSRTMSLYDHDDDMERYVKNDIPMPGQLDDLEEINGYREAFANVLVCATRAKRLRGNEQLLFERRRGLPYEHGRPIEPRKPLERNTSSWRRRNTG